MSCVLIESPPLVEVIEMVVESFLVVVPGYRVVTGDAVEINPVVWFCPVVVVDNVDIPVSCVVSKFCEVLPIPVVIVDEGLDISTLLCDVVGTLVTPIPLVVP